MKGRESLRGMIAEVENGKADFKAILAYDVSRWGRFQDADESGYYEYICKRAEMCIRDRDRSRCVVLKPLRIPPGHCAHRRSGIRRTRQECRISCGIWRT